MIFPIIEVNKFGEMHHGHAHHMKNQNLGKFGQQEFNENPNFVDNQSLKPQRGKWPEDQKNIELTQQSSEPGGNLKFESDKVKKQREMADKKRLIQKQRKDEINRENEQILKLVKELNNELTEDAKKEIKDQIAKLKASMNQKINEEKEEKQKAIEAKQKEQQKLIEAQVKEKQKIFNAKKAAAPAQKS